MKINRESILSCNNQTSSFAEDSREVLRKAGFSDSETDLFVERAVGVLDDYTAFSEKARSSYT